MTLGLDKKKPKEEFWGLVKPSEKRYDVLHIILLDMHEWNTVITENIQAG